MERSAEWEGVESVARSGKEWRGGDCGQGRSGKECRVWLGQEWKAVECREEWKVWTGVRNRTSD